MKLTLTQPQRDLIELLLDDVLEKQRNVATVAARIAATKVQSDTAHAKLRRALTEIGHTGGPATVRSLQKDLESDGTWAGKITVT